MNIIIHISKFAKDPKSLSREQAICLQDQKLHCHTGNTLANKIIITLLKQKNNERMTIHTNDKS